MVNYNSENSTMSACHPILNNVTGSHYQHHMIILKITNVFKFNNLNYHSLTLAIVIFAYKYMFDFAKVERPQAQSRRTKNIDKLFVTSTGDNVPSLTRDIPYSGQGNFAEFLTEIYVE